MRKTIPALVSILVLAGCVGADNLPPATPAGYADGTKTVSTPDLIFTASSKGIIWDGLGIVSPSDLQFSYRTTSDPDVIVATVGGENITLTYDAGRGGFFGSNANYSVRAIQYSWSTNGQVLLGGFNVNRSADNNDSFGYTTVGLQTNPAEVSALTGTATYTGQAYLEVLHGNGSTLQSTAGSGLATLNANFGAGTVDGSMSLSDDGSSTPGYAMLPTTVTINPAFILGNGFTSTLSTTPTDLSMSSVSSSSLVGNFFGVWAANVGATFSGRGTSSDGVTPATFYGGFIGQ